MNKIIKSKDKAANDLASKYCVNEQIRAERVIIVGAQGGLEGDSASYLVDPFPKRTWTGSLSSASLVLGGVEAGLPNRRFFIL